MCKKLAVVALLVAAGVVAFKKLDIQCCRKDESPEAQIQRLRAELDNTDAEIRKFIHEIAVREVEVKELEAHLKGTRSRQADNKKVILVKREELKAEAAFVKDGEKPDPARVESERELRRLVGAFKRCEEELKVKQKKLDAMRDGLSAAHDELAAYQAQRDQQAVEVEELAATLAQVRVEEMKSKVHFDKTKLSRIKQKTAELKKRIEVRKTEQDLQGRYLGKSGKPAAQPKETDVLKEVDALFGDK